MRAMHVEVVFARSETCPRWACFDRAPELSQSNEPAQGADIRELDAGATRGA